MIKNRRLRKRISWTIALVIGGAPQIFTLHYQDMVLDVIMFFVGTLLMATVAYIFNEHILA